MKKDIKNSVYDFLTFSELFLISVYKRFMNIFG